ncbi:tRNA (adenosine(37)-N6)-threonylcarbamoyltransferase complex transferase subunit TsaD [Glycocaulis sp.]|uniref:tRNA (adenosine(37)-N6)-threonylcarbamoyltransferase complex transferase subunit TsaD n=1 Tax=Glycocaulis sp. TaxID=1969725 RepID=UPI0025B8D7E6|nr:tRNA (adenosine(37)-N6)-threonylcarbamoyltransferase complex transferase subunit TsaD [Glycocaulis sp.]MCH8520909.1 tRNA (adenosine(37)-N6)-threonylcarbamoyltransferase complex transferase subunit TsaD [Glycocaulis sp.]
MALSHTSARVQAAGPVTVLGLESSCDDSAAAIVRLSPDGGVEVLAERVENQNTAHAPFGGVVPEIAARSHAERMDHLAKAVLEEAGLALADMDAIAATSGPGLIGGVMAALMTAKGLALGAGKPLIAVNHLEGHALSPRLVEPLAFPWLLLLVSGGHTQLLSVDGVGQMTRIGSTIDDAAGEAFDKSAKVLGLGFPGGPQLEKLAGKANDPSRFPLPRMLARDKSCNFSFAGLKTAVKRSFDTLDAPTETDRADLAASAQAAIAAHLAERTGRAMDIFAEHNPDARVLVAAGGVAANTAVRNALEKLAEEKGFRCLFPPLKYCTDNAAMIALAGAERLRLGLTDPLDTPARARWPLDETAASADPLIGSGRKGPKA